MYSVYCITGRVCGLEKQPRTGAKEETEMIYYVSAKNLQRGTGTDTDPFCTISQEAQMRSPEIPS